MTSRTAAILTVLALTVGTAPAGAADGEVESGAALFKQHCAKCHGDDARGLGVEAEFTPVPVPNLRTLSQRNGGAFPFVRVVETVDGRIDLDVHGGRVMPIWGEVFKFDEAGGDALAHARILNLVWYLSTIQEE